MSSRVDVLLKKYPAGQIKGSSSRENVMEVSANKRNIVQVPLEISVKQRIDSLWGSPRESAPLTIFRVPADVRESNKSVYEPRMVSIGPYYRGRASLRAMEEHKWRYLRDFASRNPAVDLTVYVQEMKALETQARRCYSESSTNVSADVDFAEMLLLDGCFILELFFKWHCKEADAMCDVGWGLNVICSDLLLLENQIPFFVIEKLYLLVAGDQGGRQTLLNLLVEHLKKNNFLIKDAAPSKELEENEDAAPHLRSGEIFHLLHIYHACFVPKPARPPPDPEKPPPPVLPCATELRRAGVTFKEKRSPQYLFDVTFDNGVMEIPPIVIDYTKKSLLVNLIAFEQTKGEKEAHTLTSYVALLDSLINTGKDVEILQRSGVMDNMLSSEDEAADFFNHLGDCSALDYDSHHFAKLFGDVKEYYGSTWHRHRAILMQDYFGSPWAIISVIAAVLLLALSVLQTFYSVYPNVPHH